MFIENEHFVIFFCVLSSILNLTIFKLLKLILKQSVHKRTSLSLR
jgi:hypothetical protein